MNTTSGRNKVLYSPTPLSDNAKMNLKTNTKLNVRARMYPSELQIVTDVSLSVTECSNVVYNHNTSHKCTMSATSWQCPVPLLLNPDTDSNFPFILDNWRTRLQLIHLGYNY